MAISRLFDISRRSMITYQRAMDVTSHNIANAGNEDYSRQRANLSTELTEKFAGITWGAGIKMDDIERIRNSLTESQIISNNQSYSFNERQAVLLGGVESTLSEPSELGISNLLGKFFNSWSELSTNPTSSALRGNVIYAAQNLAVKVKSINDDFTTIKSNIYNEFGDKIRDVNNHLQEIQSINRQIAEVGAIGNNANDLLDVRDKLINELSNLVNITVHYDSDNTASISIGGVFAVNSASSTEFEMNHTDGNLSMVSKTGGNVVALNSGELGALTNIFSNKIPEYQNKLDAVIGQLVTSVNGIHTNGFTLDDPPQTAYDFFSGYINGELKIADEILADRNKIAVSGDGTNGNGDLAIQIFELNDAKILNGSTLRDEYFSFVSQIGSDKQNADRSVEASGIVLSQLENQRASFSAVSVDEEMLDVIRFQKAYSASAKLIQMANEMLDTLINIV